MKNYKEKYEKALERCKEEFNFNNLAYSHEEIKQKLKHVFPELKENEDERIRKELIEYLKTRLRTSFNQEVRICKDGIAWLEKQGHDGKMWIYRDVYLKEKEQLVQDGIDDVLQHPQKYGLEKQGEQKPFDYEHANIQQSDFAPKAEPKFKVGDWIVYCNEDVDLITGIEETGYLINEGGYIPFTCQEDMRLWTIRYVKRGDILYEQETNSILLVHERSGNWLQTLCDYWMVKEKFHVEFPYENYGFVQKMSLIPATKEQRDALFAKMHEAGYEWDAEKKELKKIKQNPAEWSEEDENLLELSFENLTELKDRYGEEYGKVGDCISWLKSLKERMEV